MALCCQLSRLLEQADGTKPVYLVELFHLLLHLYHSPPKHSSFGRLRHVVVGLGGLQGKDIKSGGRNTRHQHRTAPKSENIYIKLLVKVSRALAAGLARL